MSNLALSTPFGSCFLASNFSSRTTRHPQVHFRTNLLFLVLFAILYALSAFTATLTNWCSRLALLQSPAPYQEAALLNELRERKCRQSAETVNGKLSGKGLTRMFSYLPRQWRLVPPAGVEPASLHVPMKITLICSARKMADPEGLAPSTYRFKGGCSTLRYGSMKWLPGRDSHP